MKNLIEKFINYLKIEKNYSIHTIKNYEIDLKNLAEFLKNQTKNLQDFDRRLGREYLSGLYANNYKPTTISRKISSIKSFLKFLTSENLLEKNNFLYTRLPKKSKNIPIFLSQDEMFDLLNAPEGDQKFELRDTAILEILYSTGIRVAELISIKIQDIDLFGETIKILGKGRKERIVPIGTNSIKIVKKYIDEIIFKYSLTSKDFLFRNFKGEVLNVRSVSRIISKYIRKLALTKKISPHKIRHTFATHLLNQGCDIRSVQEMLGHANLSTTQIYAHLDINRLKKDYNKAHPHSKSK